MSAHDDVMDAAGDASRQGALGRYRAEILAEAAVTVRAAAPRDLDNEVDEHTFQVLNDLAAKIASGDLS